ncbi:hypothetical protein ELI03_03205 [Rhizobium leguminosarum]|uniref:Uncharacterized protein n=1 Tax=Rhizobium leguminosarum TaxID=384 RepID=A0A4Q8XVK2_RHILE|nr:hypothetical protein ELI03_03205 [Rhizobium leguminosarum]
MSQQNASIYTRRPVDHPTPFEPTECFNLTRKGSREMLFPSLMGMDGASCRRSHCAGGEGSGRGRSAGSDQDASRHPVPVASAVKSSKESGREKA